MALAATVSLPTLPDSPGGLPRGLSARLARAPLRLRPVPRLRPDLSVVIVNFCQWRNTARLTGQLRANECVRSGAAEVVIVDNHSPKSPLLRRLRRARGVAVRRFGRNRGFARAVNEGCRLGQGRWLLLLNPDMTLTPDFLDRVYDHAKQLEAQDPRAGVVGFGLRHGDGSPQASSGPFPTLLNTLAGLFLPRSRRKCRLARTESRAEVPWVTGCCLLVRRDCWDQLGGFDEGFFLYYEDVDLCRRARDLGWSVWHDPGLEVIHHAPLHARRVPPPLRLMTRHALLTYGAKHWPRWQSRILSGVVWLEAYCRQRWASWRGRDEAVHFYGELRGLIGDLLHSRPGSVARRLREAAARLDGYAAEQDGIGSEG